MRGGLSAGGRCGAGLVDPHQGTGRRGRGRRGLRRLPTAGVDIFHISNFKLEIGDPTLARSVPSRDPGLSNPDPRPLIPAPFFRSACLRAAVVLSIAILVAVPWYHRRAVQNPDYLSYYFLDRHLLGFATGTQPHGDQPWWYYLPLLLGGGLPWIGYLLSVRGQGRGPGVRDQHVPGLIGVRPDPDPVPRPRRPPPALVLAGRLVAVLDAARSKLVTYLWPAFPPVAILAALAWAGAIDGTLAEKPAFVCPDLRVFLAGRSRRVAACGCWVAGVFGLRYGWPVWAAVATVAAAAPLPLVPWRVGRAKAGLAQPSFAWPPSSWWR